MSSTSSQFHLTHHQRSSGWVKQLVLYCQTYFVLRLILLPTLLTCTNHALYHCTQEAWTYFHLSQQYQVYFLPKCQSCVLKFYGIAKKISNFSGPPKKLSGVGIVNSPYFQPCSLKPTVNIRCAAPATDPGDQTRCGRHKQVSPGHCHRLSSCLACGHLCCHRAI